MHDVMHAMGTAHDFDFLFGRWGVHNRRLRRRLAGSGEWEEFSAEHVARPLLDGMGNEDEFRTDHDGGMIGMSFRFFDPKAAAVVDLLGRQPPLRPARSARRRLVRRRHRDVRGDRHAGRASRSACASCGRRSRPRSRAGSSRSPPTAARPGRRTGSWSSRPRVTSDERGGRGQARLRARLQGRPAGSRRARERRAAEVVRDRHGSRARARRGGGARARGPAAGRALAGGRARVRHPAPLRRRLLLPADLAPGATRTSCGRRSGPRQASTSRPSCRGRSPQATTRRSASGSSVRSATSRQPGARYLRSPRRVGDMDAYLGDSYAGPV